MEKIKSPICFSVARETDIEHKCLGSVPSYYFKRETIMTRYGNVQKYEKP